MEHRIANVKVKLLHIDGICFKDSYISCQFAVVDKLEWQAIECILDKTLVNESLDKPLFDESFNFCNIEESKHDTYKIKFTASRVTVSKMGSNIMAGDFVYLTFNIKDFVAKRVFMSSKPQE